MQFLIKKVFNQCIKDEMQKKYLLIYSCWPRNIIEKLVSSEQTMIGLLMKFYIQYKFLSFNAFGMENISFEENVVFCLSLILQFAICFIPFVLLFICLLILFYYLIGFNLFDLMLICSIIYLFYQLFALLSICFIAYLLLVLLPLCFIANLFFYLFVLCKLL